MKNILFIFDKNKKKITHLDIRKMARTKQRLINYNTSGATSIPAAGDLQHGEIAVRYEKTNPALFIKDNEDNIVTFIASGAISTAIENAQGNVNQLSSATYNFIETDAPNTYLTIASAESTYYTSGDVNTQISGVQDTLQDEIDDINETIEKIDVGAVSAITSEKIEHWDSAYTQGHVHANMGVLTALTAEEVAKWNASAHNHSNKDVLDGITSEKVTAWDNAVNSAITGVTVNNEPATISSHVAEITISTATTTTDGLMSAADKTRLDGIESGAQVNIIESVKVDGTALTITNKAVDITLTGYAQSIEYVKSANTIYLKNSTGGTLGTVDTNDFIKDGMVSSVTISEGNLVITFNTDAGHDDISIPLTDIFDPDNYYNKTETDAQISAATAAASAASVNSAKTYTDEVSGSIATLVYTKADKSEVTTLSGNVVTELDKKVDKIEGKQLSTEDYTTAEKEKLGSIAASAQVNTIEIVKVNGTALTPDSDKAVDVIIPAAGTLDTTVATALTPSATESFSGTVQLHKVAKTGTYNDLIDTPTKVSDFINDLEFVSNSTLTGTYATSADTYNAITAATSDVSELSGSVETVETNLNTLSGEIFSHYATSADTYNAIDAVDDKVEALSGVTPNDIVFTTISNADANHTQSGAKSNYDTNSQAMQLDLTNLVIDCGTF